MIWRPTPPGGSDIVGDVRRFTIDTAEWRAFEFVSPLTPRQTYLVFVSPQTHFSVTPVPRDWRTAAPDELLERLGILRPPGPSRLRHIDW